MSIKKTYFNSFKKKFKNRHFYLATSFHTKNLVEIKKAAITHNTIPIVELVKEKKLDPSLAISLNAETIELKGRE